MKRERDTHTQRHTERQRDREKVYVCVCPSLCVLDGEGSKLF